MRTAFDDQIALHPELPELRLLRELTTTLNRMRLIELAIGADGRNRTGLKPFSTITGRNAPSASEFIFGPARWLRGFIKPPEGFGLAYLDFKAEEVAIVAAMSGDARLAEHYASAAMSTGGSPSPRDSATRARPGSRARRFAISSRCCSWRFGYGMQAPSLARKTGKTLAEAKELLRLHAATYPDCHALARRDRRSRQA